MQVIEINNVRCLVSPGDVEHIDAIRRRVAAYEWNNANRYGESFLLNSGSTDEAKRRLVIVKALGLSIVYRAKGGYGAIWRGHGFKTVFNSPAGAREHIRGMETAEMRKAKSVGTESRVSGKINRTIGDLIVDCSVAMAHKGSSQRYGVTKMTKFTETEIANFPAYRIVSRSERHDGFTVLCDGDVIAKDSKRGFWDSYTVGTVASYAIKSDMDPIAAVERAIQNGHETHYIFANGVSLTSHKRAQETYVAVEIGMKVFLEGRKFIIVKTPNNNLGLKPAE